MFTQKYFDQRVLSLGLEIVEGSISDLETAIDAVKALLGGRDLGVLEETMEDSSVRTGMAELSNDLSVARISPISVKMILEFTMPDPFFYSDTQVSDTTVINVSPKTYTINNTGTVEKCNPSIVLAGPLNNPEITNTSNNISVKYNGIIALGHSVTIDLNPETDEYRAVTDLGVNVIGNITHDGDAAYMVLNSGSNAISVTDDTHSTGTVTIEFYPPYT